MFVPTSTMVNPHEFGYSTYKERGLGKKTISQKESRTQLRSFLCVAKLQLLSAITLSSECTLAENWNQEQSWGENPRPLTWNEGLSSCT